MAGAYGGPPLDQSTALKGPRGDAAVGAVAVDGPVTEATGTVARGRFRFKACYSKALAVDPSVEGALKLTLNVSADGAVASCTVVSSSVPSGLSQCACAGARLLQFKESSGASKVTLPLTFKRLPS